MKRQVTAPALLAVYFVLLSINNLPHHIHYTSRPFSPSPNTLSLHQLIMRFMDANAERARGTSSKG